MFWVGAAVGVHEALTAKPQYVHISKVDTLAVGTYLEYHPKRSKFQAQKELWKYNWEHLIPAIVKWWTKAIIGSVFFVLPLWLLVYYILVKPFILERNKQ